ncbi:MAG: OmpH family outer membrane protein [Bacteroidaceae bacterium]|jgi:outer membrane protein|nr:OmpH family outer membrane protein [Bacteroidaceae bacterium]
MKKILFAALMLLAPLTMSAQKFGHFNSSEIVQLMPEYTTAQTELQTLAKQYEDDQKRMQEELQKKADDFQKEQANMLENLRARREQELNDLYQRYQQSLADNQQAFQKAQAEKMQAISEKITNAVKQIGEAGGYVYIMDVTSGIPYISTKLSTDVTPELKKALGI